MRFDLGALTGSNSALALVPLLLAALLLVRGTPVLVARRQLGDKRHVRAAALLQATSLPFIVAATMIGEEIGVLSASTSAALVAAGSRVGPDLPDRRAVAAERAYCACSGPGLTASNADPGTRLSCSMSASFQRASAAPLM